MSPDEFRLKTGLLGFTARDLDSIFTELDGRAREVLNGHGQVPEHVGEVVSAWWDCLLYTSPSPRDLSTSRMPSSA